MSWENQTFEKYWYADLRFSDHCVGGVLCFSLSTVVYFENLEGINIIGVFYVVGNRKM